MFALRKSVALDQPAPTINHPAPASGAFAEATIASAWQTIMVLFKLRIVVLLLFAGIGGAFLAADGWPGLSALGWLFFSGGLTAAGASALNQYLERERDLIMQRTRRRIQVTSSIINAGWVPGIAIALIVVPTLLTLPIHPTLAVWSLTGAVIYVGVYTIWLKPRTTLNIVIGGLAGSCAVLSGGAAVGNWRDFGVLGLALLIFLWTPTHFWSLAIVYREDYRNTGVPMLPARTTLPRAAGWVLLHTAATGVTALSLGLHPALGWLYGLIAIPATAHLIWRSYRLLRQPTPEQARALFVASNGYLVLILAAICCDAMLAHW